MNKEMTPKEALEVIKQRGIEYGDATIGSVFKEECDIVDQALERAKKEHELLELYRDFHYGNHDAETDHDILRQIKQLEEELK